MRGWFAALIGYAIMIGAVYGAVWLLGQCCGQYLWRIYYP